MSSVRDLVVQVGTLLGRSARDVQPFVRTLEENWYDSVQSLKDATADDLSALGLPRRFAVELCSAAAVGRSGKSSGSKGKASSKGKEESHYDDRGKGKGKNKGKGKDREDSKGKNKGKGKSRGELVATVPIDVSGLSSESDFKFRPKLLGNKGANVFHIQDQAGVQVELQGYDDDGYMEFVITAPDEASLEKASAMCDDLVSAVFDEFEAYAGDGSRGKGKGKNKKGGEKGKGKGKEKGKSKHRGAYEIRIPIDSDGIDPEFHLRAKLVGEGGRNVKHIEAAAKAHLRVEYDDGEGMAFTISADDEAAVESAREMCEDLLSTVLEEAGVSRKRARPDGGKKGGKGKRKGDGGDDRMRKAPRTDL